MIVKKSNHELIRKADQLYVKAEPYITKWNYVMFETPVVEKWSSKGYRLVKRARSIESRLNIN